MKNFIKSYWWKFLLLIAIWFICYAMKITLSREHLFWTFSSVMQSFVALGALLGMVAVSRLQVINNRIEDVSSDLRGLVSSFSDILTNYFLPLDILRVAKKLVQERAGPKMLGEKEPRIIKIELGIKQLEKLFEEEKNIKKQIIDFVKKIVVVTTFALVFLIITPLLIEIYAGAVSLVVILYLAIPSLIATVKLIKEIL